MRLKKRGLGALALFFILGLTGTSFSFGSPIAYKKVKVGRVSAHVVVADLSSPRIEVSLQVSSRHSSNGAFPHESFARMVKTAHPTAAIDGTYYDTRTFKPIGTLVSYGQMLQSGTHGVAVCFDESNRIYFYKIRDLRSFPWQSFKVILSTGPTLVEEGHMNLFPRSEHFRDPDLFRPASRSAIGITANNKLLLVAVPGKIRFRDLAWIMRKAGAVHAVALDGGSSTALYYRGRYLVRPSRAMTNVFMLYEEPNRVSPEASLSGWEQKHPRIVSPATSKNDVWKEAVVSKE